VKARLSTDGGARGNPGPAAYGFVLEAEDGTVLAAHGERIGVATNNVAEYRGLIAGLEKALELAVNEVEVVSDSELLVRQMRGEYRVKSASLRELSLEAARLARKVGDVTYTSVRREHNELADRLVNEALDDVLPVEPTTTTTYDIGAYADELASAGDNVTVGTRLLFENERVRIWALTLDPGERIPFHRHRTSYFYRSHDDGLLRVRFPDGTATVYPTTVDEVHFHEIGADDLVVHDLENVGSTRVSFTTVELL
jgi:ribonuclease HI